MNITSDGKMSNKHDVIQLESKTFFKDLNLLQIIFILFSLTIYRTIWKNSILFDIKISTVQTFLIDEIHSF